MRGGELRGGGSCPVAVIAGHGFRSGFKEDFLPSCCGKTGKTDGDTDEMKKNPHLYAVERCLINYCKNFLELVVQ